MSHITLHIITCAYLYIMCLVAKNRTACLVRLEVTLLMCVFLASELCWRWYSAVGVCLAPRNSSICVPTDLVNSSVNSTLSDSCFSPCTYSLPVILHMMCIRGPTHTMTVGACVTTQTNGFRLLASCRTLCTWIDRQGIQGKL